MVFNHILKIVMSHLCHSCHSHCFQQESEQVLLAYIWYRSVCHLQAAQRGTWHLAQEQLQGHLPATRNLYTIVKILVKAALTKILVPNVWNPSSNRYLIISLKYFWSSVLQIFSSFQSFHDSGSLFRGNI